MFELEVVRVGEQREIAGRLCRASFSGVGNIGVCRVQNQACYDIHYYPFSELHFQSQPNDHPIRVRPVKS